MIFFFFFFSRSDHQSGVVWLPAFFPHPPFTWPHLLSERAGEQPEIPAGGQWRGWGGLLTQVQTPFSRICKPHILGKQWWHRALNLFKTFLMVPSTDSGTWFWNFCRVGSKLPVMNSTMLQETEMSDSSIKGLFFFFYLSFKLIKIKRTRLWEMLFRLYFCVIRWRKVDRG